MLGERDLFQKKNFFEQANRVPLIVSCPDRFPAGGRSNALASLVDLYPTILELGAPGAEADLPEPLDGRSLVPQMLNGDDRSRGENTVYGEILSETTLAPMLMIRRGRWKYIWSMIDPPLLFDLEADPMELTNLAGRPDIAETERAFEEEVSQRWDVEALNQAVLLSQRRRLYVLDALNKGARADWTGPLPLTGRSAYCGDDLGYYDWTAAGNLA